MIKYQAKIKKDGHAYSVEFPDLPGCFSSGRSLDEAQKMASEALDLFLEEARDPKWKVPKARVRKGKHYYWIQPSSGIAIALHIRTLRRKLRLTQAQLAKRVGMPTQQLQKLEMPGKSNPTVKTLAALSKAFNKNLKIDLAS